MLSIGHQAPRLTTAAGRGAGSWRSAWVGHRPGRYRRPRRRWSRPAATPDSSSPLTGRPPPSSWSGISHWPS